MDSKLKYKKLSMTDVTRTTAIGLALSSLETILVELDIAGTRHSAPTPELWTPGGPKEKWPPRMSVAGSQRRSGSPLKSCFSQCQKAIHIVNKIANDEERGTMNKRNEKDLARYHALAGE